MKHWLSKEPTGDGIRQLKLLVCIGHQKLFHFHNRVLFYFISIIERVHMGTNPMRNYEWGGGKVSNSMHPHQQCEKYHLEDGSLTTKE